MAARSKKKPSKKQKKRTSRVPKILPFVLWIIALAPITTAAFYLFGSAEVRAKLEQDLAEVIYLIRDASWAPQPVTDFLAKIEDYIPNHVGMVVDAEEAGRDEEHFIAGTPRASERAVLIEKSNYNTIYDEESRTLLIAARLQKNKPSPYPNQFPNELWNQLLNTLSTQYPKRFEEVWLYTGPIYNRRRSRGAGVSLRPEAYYAIAFDVTDEGGLRSISFLLPVTTTRKDLSVHLSSIAAIEKRTGLRFVPDLPPHQRIALAAWRNERLW